MLYAGYGGDKETVAEMTRVIDDLATVIYHPSNDGSSLGYRHSNKFLAIRDFLGAWAKEHGLKRYLM